MMEPFSALAMAGGILMIGTIWYWMFETHRTRHQTAIRKALIEKAGSVQELSELLQTTAGQRLFADLSSGGDPLRSVLSSVHRGVLRCC